MIIARLRGGMGNQMFTYAFSRHLAIINNTKLKLDLSYVKMSKFNDYNLNEFNIPAKVIPMPLGSVTLSKITYKILKILFKIFNKEDLYYREPGEEAIYFKKDLLKKKIFIFDGYATCEDYFEDISELIKKEFTLKKKLNKENELMLKEIIDSNSVCIHIRRGDRLLTKNKIMEPCSLEYYNNSIKLITKKIKNPHFFVFSDDPEWVKENFKIDFLITYVNINNGPAGVSRDLNLMKHCKHLIIANSTTSWWAAWLSENRGKKGEEKVIIAPEKWFSSDIDQGDVIPKRWIRMEG